MRWFVGASVLLAMLAYTVLLFYSHSKLLKSEQRRGEESAFDVHAYDPARRLSFEDFVQDELDNEAIEDWEEGELLKVDELFDPFLESLDRDFFAIEEMDEWLEEKSEDF